MSIKIEHHQNTDKDVTMSTHPMQLRKRRRLSEVAYPGYKTYRVVKKTTRLERTDGITEHFLYVTTGLVVVAAIVGIVYSFVMIAQVL